MINAVHHDMPLIVIGAMLREKLVFHHRAVDEADCCLLARCAGSKPWHLLRIQLNSLLDDRR